MLGNVFSVLRIFLPGEAMRPRHRQGQGCLESGLRKLSVILILVLPSHDLGLKSQWSRVYPEGSGGFSFSLEAGQRGTSIISFSKSSLYLFRIVTSVTFAISAISLWVFLSFVRTVAIYVAAAAIPAGP